MLVFETINEKYNSFEKIKDLYDYLQNKCKLVMGLQ